jgi:hypothetical protein
MGISNFYGRFLPKVARIRAPFYAALAQSKDALLIVHHVSAFQQAKAALSMPVSHVVPGAVLSVTTDTKISGILQQ